MNSLIQVSGKKVSRMDKENNLKMVVYMMAISKMVLKKAKESINIEMGPNIKVRGKITKRMAMGK